MLAGARLALVIALASCAQPSVQTQFFSTISNVHDPEILADLRSIAAAPARQTKGGEDRETAEGALASCMVAVGTYVPPSALALSTFVRNYHDEPAIEGCLVTDYGNTAYAQTCARSDGTASPAFACTSLLPGCMLSENGDDTLSVASWTAPCGLPCALPTMPASLTALAIKYQARCTAERETEAGARFDAEIDLALATVQHMRPRQSGLR
jgi:hypothetical protein